MFLARFQRPLALLLVAVASAAGVAITTVYPTPAYAAVPNITSMGGNINVLPSAVDAATSAAGGMSKADMMAIYMYKASKSPEFWALYEQAKRQAASTGGELVLSSEVAAEAKTVYPAAAKYGKYVKTVGHAAGSVGAVMGVYEVSSTLTNGAMNLVGLDATGTVCSSTGRDLWGLAVQTAAGASCSGFDQKIADTFEPNKDAAAGWEGRSCSPDPDEGCATFTGSYLWNASSKYLCFAISNFAKGAGRNSMGAPGMVVRFDDGTTRGIASWAYRDDAIPSNMYCGNGPTWRFEFGTSPDRTLDGISYGTGSDESSLVPIRQATGNPTRTLKCVTLGSDGKEYVRESDPFFESAGVLPDPKCSDLPAGVIGTGVEIKETGGEKDDTIWGTKTSDAVKNALTGGCGTTAATQCELDLLKDGKSCANGADCQGWFKDPDKSKYECRYGGKVVSLSECTVYAPRWEPEQATKGDTLGDPKTGEPLKNPRPELNPNTDKAQMNPAPAPANQEVRDACFPSGYGIFNPVNWVLQPVGCALRAAFIPRPSVVNTQNARVNTAVRSGGIGGVQNVINGLVLVPTGNGCTGIPVDIDNGLLKIHTRLLSACPGDPLQAVAAATKTIVGGAAVSAAALSILRYFGVVFGFVGLGARIEVAQLEAKYRRGSE